MQTHPIYINLFGTGIRYWECELPQSTYEQMEQVRLERNTTWEYLLFDFAFLAKFGYKHWSEMAPQKEQAGLILDPMNRIEIKQAQRIISRFKAIELTGGDTLFPLHNVSNTAIKIQSDETVKRFILAQLEKGLIGKFQLTSPSFDVNELLYETKTIQHYQFLSNIRYIGQPLRNKKDDSVCTSSMVIWE